MTSTKTNDAATERLLSYLQPRKDTRSPEQINAGRSASEALVKTQHSGRRATGSDPQTDAALRYLYAAQDAKGSTDA